ncbi:helix-turn-helix transcriptional regulator [Nocardioides allogilvus]|uniref:helix-turn-helix transcriptional regulator n=1 Tax=Nocardioides allogilvus TaxID=2072017 RepID=UPI0022B7F220|nr:histidine kinase [Nocardioides allogilvus]
MAQGVNGLLLRLANAQRAGDARALAAQEAERHRIAQELHDEVGQSLTVVLLGLKQVEGRAPADLVPELAAVRESARAGLDDVRRVARRLRPGVLDDLGLTSALAALTTDFAAHSAASVRRSFTPGLPALSPEAEVVIYRVAEEALTNAARHADAREVELSLQRLGGSVVLEVRDDGRGFEGLAEGSGLMGMRERAALVRAEFVCDQPAAARDYRQTADPGRRRGGCRVIRILLADDHTLVRRGVRLILEQEPDSKVVAEAADGAEAVERVRDTEVDLVVLDIAMPRG